MACPMSAGEKVNVKSLIYNTLCHAKKKIFTLPIKHEPARTNQKPQATNQKPPGTHQESTKIPQEPAKTNQYPCIRSNTWLSGAYLISGIFACANRYDIAWT